MDFAKVIGSCFLLVLLVVDAYSCEHLHLANFIIPDWQARSDLFIYHTPASAKVDYRENLPQSYGLFDVINAYFGIRPEGTSWTGLTNKDVFRHVKNFYVIYTSDQLINGLHVSHFELNDPLFLGDLSYSIHFHSNMVVGDIADSSDVKVDLYCADNINLDEFVDKLRSVHQDDFFLFVIQYSKPQHFDEFKADVHHFFNQGAVICFPFVFSVSQSNVDHDVDLFTKNCEQMRNDFYRNHQGSEQFVCDRTAVGNLKGLPNVKSVIATGSRAANNLNTYLVYDSKYSSTFLIQYGTVIVLIFAVVFCFTLLFKISATKDITLYKPANSSKQKLD